MSTDKDPRLRNDEILNYLLRPAKSIERKMLCETFNRLSILTDINDYQYVGFGSVYFADFSLFHRMLGIKKLISIESDTSMGKRIEFNLPYSCIDTLTGWSYEALPQISWRDRRTILWLDYTGCLEGYMFDDMATFFSRALSGSVFIITINVDLKDREADTKNKSETILKKLTKDQIVKNRIRQSDLVSDIKNDKYYSILRGVIDQEIRDNIIARNKIVNSDGDKLDYKQLFNFIYKDGQTMLTVGGILFSENDKEKIRQMNFENIEFVMTDDKYYKIDVPHLTNREIHAIDKFLPKFNIDKNARKSAQDALKDVVSEDAIAKYAKIYRYYTTYTESNI
jgi:hypothetical protein